MKRGQKLEVHFDLELNQLWISKPKRPHPEDAVCTATTADATVWDTIDNFGDVVEIDIQQDSLRLTPSE